MCVLRGFIEHLVLHKRQFLRELEIQDYYLKVRIETEGSKFRWQSSLNLKEIGAEFLSQVYQIVRPVARGSLQVEFLTCFFNAGHVGTACTTQNQQGHGKGFKNLKSDINWGSFKHSLFSFLCAIQLDAHLWFSEVLISILLGRILQFQKPNIVIGSHPPPRWSSAYYLTLE